MPSESLDKKQTYPPWPTPETLYQSSERADSDLTIGTACNCPEDSECGPEDNDFKCDHIDSNQIRLLKLEPSSDRSAPLRATLVVSNFPDAGQRAGTPCRTFGVVILTGAQASSSSTVAESSGSPITWRSL
jgi:hypothetical protein